MMKQLGEERVYLLYTSFIIKGSQDKNKAGTHKPELMQKPGRSAAYWLPPSGLLSLLSYRTQDYHARYNPTYNGLSLPYQSLIKKISYKLPYDLILWRHFLSQGSLFSDYISCVKSGWGKRCDTVLRLRIQGSK